MQLNQENPDTILEIVQNNLLELKELNKCVERFCRVFTTPIVPLLKDFTCYVLQFAQKGRNPVWWSLLAQPYKV